MTRLKAYFFTFLVLGSACSFSQNRARIDSLIKAISVTKEDSTRVELLISLATYIKKHNSDSALLLTEQANKLATGINLPGKIARSMQVMGDVLMIKRQYEKAVDRYKEALSIYAKLGYKKEVGANHANLGLCYFYLSSFPESLENDFKALKIYEELQYDEGQAIVLGNIGIVHKSNKNLDKGLEYALKALEKDKKVKNVKGIGRHLGNIASIYEHQGTLLLAKDTAAANEKFKKALDAFAEASRIAEENNDHVQLGVIINNLANLYFTMGDTVKCIAYYFKAYEIDKITDNKEGMAMHLGNIGWIYHVSGKEKEAEKYTKEALGLLVNTPNLYNVSNLNENLSEIYEKLGKYNLALETYRTFIKYRDSLYNIDNARKQLETEMNFEFDKKEAVAKEESEKQAMVRNGLIAGFGLMLVLALVILRGYRNKKRANEIISEQKAEVELRRTELEVKNKEITDSIHYAKRIQKSLMPNEKYIERILKERLN